MTLDKRWASPEDFATLFQYFWHRDFPIDQKAIGAHRADWTIHIGIVVRNIADVMGLIARFETGSRKDAVLRSTDGDEIAIEWEWKDTWRQELEKLKNHKVFSNKKNEIRQLKYSVLITYATEADVKNIWNTVAETWREVRYPLILILVVFERFRKFSSRRKFKEIRISMFYKNSNKELRTAPALPWEVSGSRWSTEHVGFWS